ncbi:hypothetical protein GGF44_002887, partial [Coemansia sp. RSA 1694]
MSKVARASAITKHSQLQLLRPLLLQQHALDIPDFTLSISPAFHTVRTTVSAAETAAIDDADDDGGDTVSYQSLSMATRPRIVACIRDKLVYLGQTRRRFAGLAANVNVGSSPAFTSEVRFSDPVSKLRLGDEGMLHLAPQTTEPPTTSPSSSAADRLEPMMITGPRHIGKSHIMLQVAALFASETAVAVLYVGMCSELVLSSTDSDRVKYIQFIEHAVCTFVAYPEASQVADRWYRATRMGTDLSAMGRATSVFMRELSELCALRGITMMVFLDEYEALLDLDPLLAVINIRSLIERLGIVVVASTSTLPLPSMNLHYHHQCILTATLAPEEAMNVFVATYADLDLSDAGLERLFEAVEFHPVDIVRMLSQYENKRALLRGAEEDDVLRSLICDTLMTRNLRISQMHLRYLRNTLASQIHHGTADDVLEYEGVGRELVSVDKSPHLLRIKREIACAVFAIYHGLDTKHCSARDLQFAEPEANPTPTTPTTTTTATTTNATTTLQHRRPLTTSVVRCFPPAAAEIMYNAHFASQTVEEQFKWLFDQARTKFDVEPRVRLRYFDALLLESGRLSSKTILSLPKTSTVSGNRGGAQISTVDIRFMHVASFTGSRGQRVEPRLCTVFEQAVDAVAEYIEAAAAMHGTRSGPRYEPVASRPTIESVGAMLYFPRLGFNESWMPAEVRANSHNEGSFMAVIVRVDRLKKEEDSNVLEWGSSEFQVTWIANDPLCSLSSSSSSSGVEAVGSAGVTAATTRNKEQAPANTTGVSLESISNAGPPKDVADPDATFGIGGSWTAKALKILPHIQQMVSARKAGDVVSMGMLAVTTDERYAEIAEGDVARIL